jgi:hypothetical protein
MANPELWGVCREVCADCPDRTSRTAKIECKHPWRAEVERRYNESGDGTVPLDTEEAVKALGATVLTDETEGVRPSFQLFDQEPARKHGFIVVRIAEN